MVSILSTRVLKRRFAVALTVALSMGSLAGAGGVLFGADSSDRGDSTQREQLSVHEAAQSVRLRRHFKQVLRDMERRDIAGLSISQRENRRRRMDSLREYSRRGRFPLNLENPGRTLPYIRDSRGTLCAMAYLMDKGGASETVKRLAVENNHVYMNDIKGGPVLAWLKRNGLTLKEAARIQPRYDHMRRYYWIRPRRVADLHGDGMDSGYFHRGLLERATRVRGPRRFPRGYHSTGALTLFAGAADGLYAYRINSKKLLWKTATVAPVVGTPIVIRGRVLANIRGIGIGEWNARDGKLVRTYPIPGGAAGSPLIPRYSRNLVAASKDGTLYFFDTRTGRELGVLKLKARIVGSPIAASNLVVVAAGKEVLGIQPSDRKIAWRIQTGATIPHEPVEYYSTLYVPAGSEILSVSADKGKIQRTMRAADTITRMRMLSYHKLSVLTATNRVQVFDTKKGELMVSASPAAKYINFLPSRHGLPGGGMIKKRPSKLEFIIGISARGEVRAHPIHKGREGWALKLESVPAGTAVLPRGNRFVMTDSRGHLYIIRKNGTQEAKIKIAPAFTSRPVLAD